MGPPSHSIFEIAPSSGSSSWVGMPPLNRLKLSAGGAWKFIKNGGQKLIHAHIVLGTHANQSLMTKLVEFVNAVLGGLGHQAYSLQR